MNIDFKAVERPAPGRKNAEKTHWYPVICNREKKGLREVSTDLETHFRINHLMTEHLIYVLSAYIAEQLKDGHIVHLGELGTFSPTLRGTPAESKRKLNRKNIRGVNVRFRPGETLRKALLTANFRKVMRETKK